VFLSKIWFFLVAIGAAVALAIALTLPRSADATMLEVDQTRLGVACNLVGVLMRSDARNRVDLAGSFARTDKVVAALEQASNVDKLDDNRMKQVRDIGEDVMKTIQGARKPDFAMLIDRRGRVVARVRLDDSEFGDYASGRPLVDDALAGYLRDDLWAQNNTVYLVSAAPVVKRDPPVAYVGAVVLGHKITTELAQRLVGGFNVDLAFSLGNDDVANSRTIALDHAALLESVKKLSGDTAFDCQAKTNTRIDLRAGGEDYSAIVARLPGEASVRQAFYSVYVKKPDPRGVWAYFKEARERGGLSFDQFPWFLVGGGFLVALLLGIALMLWESDLPLRRLTAEAVRLAKGEIERLSEDAHGGKYGTIARSVNIHIDKLGREAKSAKKDLDQLLGPAPEGSLGTIDLLATTLPTVRPGGTAPSIPPPPSEFRFSDSASNLPRAQDPMPRNTPVGLPTVPARHTPPQMSAVSPPPMGSTAMPPPRTPSVAASGGPTPPGRPEFLRNTPPPRLDEDILGAAPIVPAGVSDTGPTIDPYFKQVFDQFVSVKKSCNEPVSGLTYQKFSEKLIKNRDDLMAKTGCREVRFTVYVKDGKAALKATPVKDEA
jgi:hypothetical protein